MISVSFFQSGNIIVLALKQNHQSLHDKHLPPVNKALVSCRPGVEFLKGRVFCAFSSGSLRSPKWSQADFLAGCVVLVANSRRKNDYVPINRRHPHFNHLQILILKVLQDHSDKPYTAISRKVVCCS